MDACSVDIFGRLNFFLSDCLESGMEMTEIIEFLLTSDIGERRSQLFAASVRWTIERPVAGRRCHVITHKMGFILSKIAFVPPRNKSILSAVAVFCKTTSGVYIPLVHYDYPGAAYTLMFSHGNACDLQQADGFLLHLRQVFRCSVVGYDYIGYGHSYQIGSVAGSRTEPPAPSEDGCYEAIDAVYHYVSETLRIPVDRQIWLGESIGSGPTVDLVSRLAQLEKRVGAMILVSPFWSTTRIVSSVLPWIVDMFSNGAKIGNVEAPVLIVHGERDELILPEHSRWLATECVDAQLALIAGATHNTVFLTPQTFETVGDFIDALPHNWRASIYGLPER